MTSDPNLSRRGLSRRVDRLENDTESIYELITEVRSTQDEHTRRFAGMQKTLATLTTTQDEHTRRLDQVENSLTKVNATLDQHTRRFDRIESTLNEVVRRLPEPS